MDKSYDEKDAILLIVLHYDEGSIMLLAHLSKSFTHDKMQQMLSE